MPYGRPVRLSDEQWNRLENACRDDLRQFFLNVDWLCHCRYGSRNRGLIALREVTGYRTMSQTVKAFITGKFTDCDVKALFAWCSLFGVRLSDMLSIDYRLRDEAAGVK